MKPQLTAIVATLLFAVHLAALADDFGCALGLPGQRFDLADRDQALAPLRGCYEKHIKAAPKAADETSLVLQLMTKSCANETTEVLQKYRGTTALGTTVEGERKTVECWARGVSRWLRGGSVTGRAR